MGQLFVEGQPIGLIQVKSDVWLPLQTYHSQAARWLWPGGHRKHIRPWFLHSRGLSPQCKYLGLGLLLPSVLMADLTGLAPISSKMIKKREKATAQLSASSSAPANSNKLTGNQLLLWGVAKMRMRVKKMTFVKIFPALAMWDCKDAVTLVCTPTVEKMIYNPEKASMNKTSQLFKNLSGWSLHQGLQC